MRTENAPLFLSFWTKIMVNLYGYKTLIISRIKVYIELEVDYTIMEMHKSIAGKFDCDEFCSTKISHYSAFVFNKVFAVIKTKT